MRIDLCFMLEHKQWWRSAIECDSADRQTTENACGSQWSECGERCAVLLCRSECFGKTSCLRLQGKSYLICYILFPPNMNTKWLSFTVIASAWTLTRQFSSKSVCLCRHWHDISPANRFLCVDTDTTFLQQIYLFCRQWHDISPENRFV
jgi:hypothetical protein